MVNRILTAIVVVELFLIIILYWSWNTTKTDGYCTVVTDTIHKVDTMKIEVPVVKDSLIVKYVTRVLPIVVKNDSTLSNDIPNITLADSAEVIIPIESKYYETDDYKAWVSGYEPSLDSIQIYRHTDVIETKITEIKKSNRWGCMIGIGGGMNHKAEITPMVGLMIGYKIF